MQHFDSDYMEGAHPLILERLVAHNMVKTTGYGCDDICAEAREKILAACGNPDSEVHFLVGGTQTNATIIKALLRPHEGVIAAATGHIAVHESGAIEATGHKVLTLPQHDGKLWAEEIDTYIEHFYADESFEHMVFPAMVYISQPTEYGTIYSLSELESIATICRKWQIPLFMDGARLGYGLASAEADFTLEDIARLCDVFYIGGTKVGALCGEAVVFARRKAPRHFLSIIKQHGALVAKGRLLGIQFDTLFTDDLYMKISRHAIEMAELMRSIFRAKGYEFFMETTTNQIFITLPDQRKAELERECVLSFWEKPDPDHTVVRFATSWATTEEDIRSLEAIL